MADSIAFGGKFFRRRKGYVFVHPGSQANVVLQPPILLSVTPDTGTEAGGDSVVLAGSGFLGATSVTFDGVEAASFVVDSDLQITAVTPAGTAGAVDVTVTTPGGSDTLSGGFTYEVVVAAPTISSAETVDPAGGEVSIVTVDDTTGISSVTVDSTSCTFFIVSATQLAVITPARPAGTYNVVATNSGGASAPGSITYFTPIDANTSGAYVRGDYIDNTWRDSSGNARHFQETAVANTAPEVNGSPVFNRSINAATSNQRITGLTGVTTTGNMFGTGSVAGDTYSISIVFRMEALSAPNATADYSVALLADGSRYWFLMVTSSWIRWCVYPNMDAADARELPAPSLDEWHVLDLESNAGVCRMRIDGGAWTTSFTAGPPSNLTGTFTLAQGAYTGSERFRGEIRSIVFSNVARGNTWFDNHFAWAKSKLGFQATASAPEVDEVDSDVFDPAGGDRIVLRGRSLTTATDVRIGGTAATNLKAFGATPQFNGVGTSGSSILYGTTINNYYTRTSLTISVLFYADYLVDGVSGSGYYDNPQLVGDNGTYVFMGITKNGGVHARISNGTTYGLVQQRCGKRGWHIAQLVFSSDGTTGTMKLRIDGGPWAEAAHDIIAAAWTGGTLQVGCDYTAAKFFHGKIAEIMISSTALSDSVLDNIIAYTNYTTGLNVGGIAASAYDPSALSLTAWWKHGNFALGTWTGAASAGTSGSRNLTAGTTGPTVARDEIVATVPAKSVGTVTTKTGFPLLNGGTRFLTCAGTLDTYYNSNAYSGWALIFPHDIANDVTDAYQNDAILATQTGSYWTLSLRTSGRVEIQHYYSGAASVTVGAAIELGKWSVVQWKYDGTTLAIRVNGGPWRSTAVASLGSLANTLRIGTRHDGAVGFNGKIAEIGLSDTNLGSSLDSVLGSIAQEFSLELGGVAPAAFDRASLSLTAFWKADNYAVSSVATWSGTASAGTSGSNSATQGTTSNQPTIATKIHADAHYSLTVVTPTAATNIGRVIRYANPSSLPDNVWWLRANSSAITTSGGSGTATTNWADQSGVGDSNRNATNGVSGANAGKWYSSYAAYGGKGAVTDFDAYAGETRLRTSAWSSSVTAPYTLGVIGHTIDDSSNRYMTYESATQYNAVLCGIGVPKLYIDDSAQAADTMSVSTGKNVIPGSHTAFVINGSRSRGYCNEEPPTTTPSLTNPVTLGGGAVSVGSYESNGATYGADTIAEVYAFKRPLAAHEMRTIRRYRDSYYVKAA